MDSDEFLLSISKSGGGRRRSCGEVSLASLPTNAIGTEGEDRAQERV